MVSLYGFGKPAREQPNCNAYRPRRAAWGAELQMTGKNNLENITIICALSQKALFYAKNLIHGGISHDFVYKPYRSSMQSFFVLLLFAALIILGVNWAAVSLSQAETLEQDFLKVSEEEAVEGEESPGVLGRLQKRISQTWKEGNMDLFVTAYTWHNRLTYDKEHVRRYNENPWGGGAGLSFFDEDGDSHLLFLIAFLDSWNKVEPYGGYAYFKNWRFGFNNDFRIGAGVSLGITAREQYKYIPFPLPLPVFGIGYKQLSAEAAYIPGTSNNGNVLFVWLRWTFD